MTFIDVRCIGSELLPLFFNISNCHVDFFKDFVITYFYHRKVRVYRYLAFFEFFPT